MMRANFRMVVISCCISAILATLQTTTKPYYLNTTSSTLPATLLEKTRFEELKTNCGEVIDGNEVGEGGFITSPNYPQLYPQGLNCKWTIKAGKGRRVRISIGDFDVTQTDACQDDYLTATSQGADSKGAFSSSVGRTYHGRFCGTQVPKDIVSSSDVIILEFRSSATGETCRGFSARYSFEEVKSSCGEEISSLEFDFVNSEYPNEVANQSAECHLKISHECDLQICQIRLDFVEFVLQPPVMGDCNHDRFMIRANDPPPVLCGLNTGQHVYVDVKERTSTEIHVLLNPIYPKPVGHSDENNLNYNHTIEYLYEIEDNRKWRVRVQQIPCDCQYEGSNAIAIKAPSGCLQYHTHLKGSVKSFNFDGTKQDLESCWLGTEDECNRSVWTGHLNSLDYNVCIKRAEGHCGVKYAAKEDESFLLSGTATTNGTYTKKTLFGSVSCQSDYLVIAKGQVFGLENPKAYDRYCGTAFGSGPQGPVLSFSPPFYVQVKTDQDEFTAGIDIGNRGFNIEYTLIPCSSFYMYN